MTKEELKSVSLEQLPLDNQGNLLVDIYVHLPTQNKFIRWVCAGDLFDQEKKAKLSKHVDPQVFIPLKFQVPTTINKAVDTEDANPNTEKLSQKSQEELKQIFKSITSADIPAEEAFKAVESAAEEILEKVAPETKDLKAIILNNMKYLDLMNDVSAITALSTMVAMASGFDSRKSYRDLAYACLIMDSSLSEFTETEIKQYYKDPSALAPDTLAKIKKHPARSHELAQEKLKSLSDVTMQLILNHHELFNGKGYPRGVRTESVFALVKVLALGVDIFEVLKRSQLMGTPKTIPEAVIELTEPGVEAHLKRHNKKLLDSIITFLGITLPTNK